MILYLLNTLIPYGKSLRHLQVKQVAYLIFLCIFVINFNSHSYAASGNMSLSSKPLIRSYSGYWSGLHVADMAVHITPQHTDVYIDSYGLVKALSKYHSTTSADYLPSRLNYTPLKYRTSFEQRHGERSILITYKPSGDILHEQVTPPDPAWKRPKVPESLKKDAFDPLTLFLVARQTIHQAVTQGTQHFTLSVYDGRSLSALDFIVHGRIHKTIRGKKYPVVEVEFKRRPIAGFTAKELKHMDQEEPRVTLYFSDDDMFLPLKVEAEAPIGTAVLFLEKECTSIESCLPEGMPAVQH